MSWLHLKVYMALCLMVFSSPGWCLRDPTIPAGIGAYQQSVSRGEEASSEIRLNSVLVSSGRKLAIINNKLVKLGNTINGKKVIDIQPDRVVLADESGKQTLRMTTTTVKTQP